MPIRDFPDWMLNMDVKCKGITSFFYPSQLSSEVSQAKGVCNGLDGNQVCPYRKQCLKYAIDNHESFGVWGGTSERDRRKIQRARNKYANNQIYSLEDVRFPHRMTIKPQVITFIPKRPIYGMDELMRNAS